MMPVFLQPLLTRLLWHTYGNVLTATAFLMGMAAEDLRQAELDRADPSFPVVVGIRAQRA